MPGESDSETSFDRIGEQHWGRMTTSERENFLRSLETAVERKPDWWDRRTTQDIAKIDRFDDLPPDLRGRMIMAMTDKGFSIGEQKRVEGIIEEIK